MAITQFWMHIVGERKPSRTKRSGSRGNGNEKDDEFLICCKTTQVRMLKRETYSIKNLFCKSIIYHTEITKEECRLSICWKLPERSFD